MNQNARQYHRRRDFIVRRLNEKSFEFASLPSRFILRLSLPMNRALAKTILPRPAKRRTRRDGFPETRLRREVRPLLPRLLWQLSTPLIEAERSD